MALALDAASAGPAAGDTASITWSHTCAGANRLLLVGVALRSNIAPSVSGVTYNGVALTKLDHADDLNRARSELWYLVAPDTGAHDVVVTFPSGARAAAYGVSFTGAHQASPFGTVAKATGTSSAPSINVSSATGELVVDVTPAVTPTTGSAGAGQTELLNLADSGNMRGFGSREAGAASVTMSWAWADSRDYALLGVSVKPGGETHQGAATVAGVSGVAAAGSRVALGSATVAAVSVVGAAALVGKFGAAAVAAVSSVGASGALAAVGVAAVAAQSAASVAGALAAIGQAAVTAVSSVAASGQTAALDQPGGLVTSTALVGGLGVSSALLGAVSITTARVGGLTATMAALGGVQASTGLVGDLAVANTTAGG